MAFSNIQEVRQEQSSDAEVVAVDNLYALATSPSGYFLRKTGSNTFENAQPTDTVAAWGSITGTMSSQSDLQSALTARALIASPLSQFSTTTSAQLLGVMSDETGTGSLVFATSPTLVTPVLGVATATTINKVTITAPATGATLTLVEGGSLITAGAYAITLTATATTSLTLPTSGTLGIKNQEIATYATGTAYALTDTAAAINVGTTDPVIVLNVAGTYLIFAQVNLAYTGATVVAETAALKVRRTNNTAADLSVVVPIDLPVSTTLTNTYGIVQIPPFIYTTAATDDSVTIFGNVSAALSAGTIDATAIGTSIVAIRLY